MLAQPTADTLENLTATARANDTSDAPPQASRITEGAPSSDCEGGSSLSSSPSDDEFLREREVESTSEGMPSGELDEDPPKAEAASSGE
jgi:hypothetical protein